MPNYVQIAQSIGLVFSQNLIMKPVESDIIGNGGKKWGFPIQTLLWIWPAFEPNLVISRSIPRDIFQFPVTFTWYLSIL